MFHLRKQQYRKYTLILLNSFELKVQTQRLFQELILVQCDNNIKDKSYLKYSKYTEDMKIISCSQDIGIKISTFENVVIIE